VSVLQVWRLRARGVYLQLSPENLTKLPNSEFTFKQMIDGAVSKGVQRKDIGPKPVARKGSLTPHGMPPGFAVLPRLNSTNAAESCQ
jgi:hypothetical protein